MPKRRTSRRRHRGRSAPGLPRRTMLMKRNLTLIGCVGLGAGLMYLLVPDRGRRRRTLLRDRAVHLRNQTRDGLDTAWRDLRNRTRGLAAGARSRLRRERVDDEVLRERVRAKLGRSVSHPHAIEVAAHQGFITLRGHILAGEAGRL